MDEAILWYEGSGIADKRYLTADERGSITSVTNATGVVMQINSYDDYGIPATTNLGRFQYTGQTWLPEVDLYYYKARIYSPTLGRFLQTDPIGYEDGLNWYDYVGGDPVNGRDPSGLLDIVVTGVGGSNDDIVVTGGSSLGGFGFDTFFFFPPIFSSDNYGDFGRFDPIENEIVVTAKPKNDKKKKRPQRPQPQPRSLDLCGSERNSQYVPEGIGAASFQGACARHDLCYGTPGSPQEQCDQQFGQAILDECKIRGGAFCAIAAYAYYKVLSTTGLGLGTDAYDNAQQEALLRRFSAPRP